MERVKILHVFGRMSRGGAEIRTLELMRHINRKKFLMHFCVLSGLSGELDTEIISLGGQIIKCRLDLGFNKCFKKILDAERYDVVHSHVHYFSGYILRLAYKKKICGRIAHFRNIADDHGNSLRRRIQRNILKKWINKYATKILAVSEGAIQASWGEKWKQDSRCRIVYNGIDTNPFKKTIDIFRIRKELGFNAHDIVYIHVGRIDPQKNHERLIRIFIKIAKLQAQAKLLIVGRGGNEIEGKLRRILKDAGLEHRIVFLGEREDVPALLKSADLLIFPSIREGLPGAVLEACVAGIPVLASDLSGIKEIAQHFRDVRAMTLDHSDEKWALEAMNLVGSVQKNEDALELFEKSPFSMKRSIELHEKIWGSN